MKVTRQAEHECGSAGAGQPFSLTPALSRWEREDRVQRWPGAGGVAGAKLRLRLCAFAPLRSHLVQPRRLR